jgi:hypothetical protein
MTTPFISVHPSFISSSVPFLTRSSKDGSAP